MAENTTLLILRLEGVLQSWGEHSKWDSRDTASMPTKSGVIGLLACAMGLERDSKEISQLSQAVSMGVRADRGGSLLRGYQTVSPLPGYELNTADGGHRSNGTILSPRQYLQDASFLVVIQAEEPWLSRSIQALKDPQWPIFLGRKNCVPTRPVLEAVTEDYPDILSALRGWSAAERPDKAMLYECETPDANLSSFSRPDERRAGYRNFIYRRVYRGILEGVGECI